MSKKNNFLLLFRTLSIKEFNQFSDYLTGTKYKRKEANQIFDYYKKFHNNRKKLPAEEQIFKEIFEHLPSGKTGLKKLKNGLSDLNILLKDFLVQQKILEKKFERELLWLDILEERNLDHRANLHAQQIQKGLDNEKNPSMWHSFFQLKLLYFFCTKTVSDASDNHIKNLKKGLQTLEIFFTRHFFWFSAELEMLKFAVKNHIPSIFSVPAKSFAQQNFANFSPATKASILMGNLSTMPTEESFRKLRELLKNNGDYLSRKEKNTSLNVLTNYLANEIREGKTDRNKEVFSIYQLSQKEDFLIFYEIINPRHFHNYLNAACYEKEFDFAHNFILNNSQYLPEKSRNQNVVTSKAMLAFKQKDFEVVIEILEKRHNFDTLSEIAARIYILGSFFELENVESLELGLIAFDRMLKRQEKKLPESAQNAAKNFKYFLEQIHLRRLPKADLEQKLSKTKNLFFQPWLKEKMKNYKSL